MAKGLCCRAAAAGALGKRLRMTVHDACGRTREACGICEIGQSCRNPQKRVFQFRFLPGVECQLVAKHCEVTEAMEDQYDRNIANGHEILSMNGGPPTRVGTSPVGYTVPPLRHLLPQAPG
jgi:hypothetical protein